MKLVSPYSKFLERTILLLIIAALVLSPLPIGSVKPVHLLIIQISSFFIFLLWLIKSIIEEKTPFLSIKPYLPILLFLVLCLFQTVPFPSYIVGALSGKSLEIWELTYSILADIGSSSDMKLFTISLYPNETMKQTLLLLSYFTFGIVVSKSFGRVLNIKLAIIPILAIMMMEALLGIYQYLLSGGQEVARGTFVNRNHFAGFIEICFPLALGYLLSIKQGNKSDKKSFVGRLISSNLKHILLAIMMGIVLLSIMLSESRGGIFSILVSLFFFYIVFSKFAPKGIETKWIIYIIVAVCLLLGVYIGIYPIIERYLFAWEYFSSLKRILVWKDTVSIIRDFPLFGTGLGTFSHVFPLYKISMIKPLRFEESHNDYLQILSETGLLGFLLIMLALVLFFLSSVRNLARLSSEQDHLRLFLLLGALTGILSILIHSFVDFNLQIPSNALYFTFLIGFSVAIGSKTNDPEMKTNKLGLGSRE